MSQVHLTSLAVNGLPSCHLTPWRSGKVSSVPSSLHDQLTAKSGTIDCILFCGTSCLYITRLLKTPIIGRLTAAVASSCSDMLAGLSKCDILRMPPGCCAGASPAISKPNNEPDTASLAANRRIAMRLPSVGLLRQSPTFFAARRSQEPTADATGLLLVQPDVFEAPAVEYAVDHDLQTLEPRLPAGRKAQVIDDRSRLIFLQPAIDLPHQPLAFLLVGLDRLLLKQLLQFRVAVAGVV